MRPLLIVKTGSTLPELLARRGDYEDWIERGLSSDALELDVVDVSSGAALPNADRVSGVVVTGSSAMVSERAPWSETTAGWLADAARADVPILGICYGHQLLAHGLGGTVGANPRGREIGTVRVARNRADDALLDGLPEELTVQVTHRETVLTLPPGARRLARNAMDDHQAFRFGARAWGVQFHPEFDAEVSRAYLTARSELLREEGLDPDALVDAVEESDHGARILSQFAGIVEKSERSTRQ